MLSHSLSHRSFAVSSHAFGQMASMRVSAC